MRSDERCWAVGRVCMYGHITMSECQCAWVTSVWWVCGWRIWYWVRMERSGCACESVTNLYWYIAPRMPHKRRNRWRGPVGPPSAHLTVHIVHAGRKRRDPGTHLLCFKRCLGRKCACILLFVFLYKLNCFFQPRHYIFPSDVWVFVLNLCW